MMVKTIASLAVVFASIAASQSGAAVAVNDHRPLLLAQRNSGDDNNGRGATPRVNKPVAPVTKPGFNGRQPDARRPEARRPGTQRPDAQRPDAQRPGTQRPGTQRLGTQRPGTQRPGTQRPGTQRLGTQRPDTRRPESRPPVVVHPRPVVPPQIDNRPVSSPRVYRDSKWGRAPFYAGPRRGTVVRVLPPQPQRHVHGGINFYFANHVWYRQQGVSFMVVAPPVGLIVPFLPSTYNRLWVGNGIYYVVDDVYYRRADRGYVVVESPVRVDDLDSYPDMPRLAIIASERQTDAELIADKIQCHIWAVDRTGFDPTIAGGNVARSSYRDRQDDYRRAITFCLEERGYTVR